MLVNAWPGLQERRSARGVTQIQKRELSKASACIVEVGSSVGARRRLRADDGHLFPNPV